MSEKCIITDPGPILEKKDMPAILQKRTKKGKIFKNLGKYAQNFKIFWKSTASCKQLLHR